MPSKLLLAAAKAAHGVRSASEFGVVTSGVVIEGKQVMDRVRRLRDEFVADTLKSIDKIRGDSKLRGFARFRDATTLEVDGTKVSAKAIIIATGSTPSVPDTFKGLDNVLTNETVFELLDLPSSLAVIGAGPLGLELAQAFSRLGVDVEVFDEGKRLAGLKDGHVTASLRAALEREMQIHTEVEIQAEAEGKTTVLSWSGQTNGKRTFSHVLVATGRPPNLKHLDLKATGLELDDHDIPVFDRTTMQCGRSSIFMAGDVDSDAPVLHEASAEGAIAGYSAAKFPLVKPSKRGPAFAVTFTDPVSAFIGKAPSDDTVVGQSDYADQGRAKVEAKNVGLVRLYADGSGRLTGAELATPAGDHLAHLLAWAMEDGQTAMQLLDRPFYHPTYEEGLRSALREICDATELAFGDDRDMGSAPGV
jgi:dihydrolipoamide dehydrogenase